MTDRAREPRWRFLALLRESTKNTFTPSGRTFSAITLAILLGSSCVASIIRDDATLRHVLEDQYRQGRYTVIMSGNTTDAPVLISTASCNNLNRLAGVSAAAPVVLMGLDSVAQIDAAVSILATTPALIPELADHDAVIGSALPFLEPGLIVGGRLGVASAVPGALTAGGVPAGSALSVHLDSRVTATPLCVATLDPGQDLAVAQPLLLASLSASGGAVSARQAISPQFDPLSDYLARPTQAVPLACGLLLAVFSAMSLRFRSSELAAYRLSGTSRRDLLSIVWLEQSLLAACFAVAATAGAIALNTHLVSAQACALRTLGAGGAWLGLFAVLATGSLRGSPTDLAKDR